MSGAVRAAIARLDNQVLALLMVNFGAVFMARNALGYLTPFIAPQLQLNNARIGLLSSGLAFSWAVSGFAISTVIGAGRRLVPILIALGVLGALFSSLSALVGSFALLIAVRMLTGVVSGPVLPLSQAIMVVTSEPSQRGLRMGVLQSFGGSLFGTVLAPLLLVPIAVTVGWPRAFLTIALLQLLSAGLLWRFLNAASLDPPRSEPRDAATVSRLGAAYAVLNVRVCSLISVAMVAWLVIGLTFYPLYLVQVRGIGQLRMGGLLSLQGAGGLLGALVVPYLSDRLGRRPVMIAFCSLGILGPLALLEAVVSPGWLAVALFASAFAGGTIPLFMATIPSESVQIGLTVTAIGAIQGVGEVLGGVVAPAAAGRLADAYGLRAALLLEIGCAAAAGLFALMLLETAPSQSARQT